mgnify:CR=1 FL=1
MRLTAHEVLTLLSLRGVGGKNVLDIAGQGDGDLWMRVSKYGLKVSEGRVRVPCTEEHLRNASVRADAIQRKCLSLGIDVVTYFDDAYPEKLRGTVDEDGSVCPPVLLYCKGDVTLLGRPCVAVIGTREPTEYGVRAAGYISESFAKSGMAVVSGLALGCDTYAHRGALRAGGCTVAVMGGGLDAVYPVENAGLADEILRAGGLLVSEYPPGAVVTRYTLVDRDRIQAALSAAVVVIQAGEKSGTMHAARAALRGGRRLYAVCYSDAVTMASDECSGNRSLLGLGAMSLRGSESISKIADEILKNGEHC